MNDNAEPSPVRVRRMAVEDLEQVQTIDQRSFNMPWPLRSFRFQLEDNPAALLWVAEVDDPQPKVVGAIVTWLLVDEVHIATISVHPDYRRRGIATRLLCTALEENARLGGVEATLEVREHNLAAQKLYHRFGFREVGRRKRYYEDNGEDALILTTYNLQDAHLDLVGC